MGITISAKTICLKLVGDNIHAGMINTILHHPNSNGSLLLYCTSMLKYSYFNTCRHKPQQYAVLHARK